MAFEALKKKLPGLVEGWSREHWYAGKVVEVKVARRIGPAEAKVTFLGHTSDAGDPEPFSVYLHFYDGAWTTTRLDAGWSSTNDSNTRAVHFLMLAIDQLGGK